MKNEIKLCDQKNANLQFEKLDRTCDHDQMKLLTKIVDVIFASFCSSQFANSECGSALTGMLSIWFVSSGCDINDISSSSNSGKLWSRTFIKL